jgi:superfamily II RNA helicase
MQVFAGARVAVVAPLKVSVLVQIDTADELMTAELMFNAAWKELDSPQLVALLSCLVPCKEKDRSSEGEVPLPLSLAKGMNMLQNFAKNICSITNVCLLAHWIRQIWSISTGTRGEPKPRTGNCCMDEVNYW